MMSESKKFDPPSLSFKDWESIHGAFKYTASYLEIAISDLSPIQRKLIFKEILNRFGTIEIKSTLKPDFLYKGKLQSVNEILAVLDENIESEMMQFSVLIQGAKMTLFNFDSSEVVFMLNPLDFESTSAKTELIEFMLDLADCGKQTVVLQKDASKGRPFLEALPERKVMIFHENIPEDFV